MDRRDFVHGAAAGAAAFAIGLRTRLFSASPKDDVIAKIAGQHDQTVKMLQDWIALPSIAAENRGYPQGAEYMAKLARDAGFQRVDLVPTAGKPGVFATLDAGAPNWLGIYFMYDVKQFDPAEWSSPPLEARLVDKPGLGKVIVGRGATNTKGPQVGVSSPRCTHSRRPAQKLPVNIVLVCEGEEEIGSPNFHADRLQARGRSGAAQMPRRHHSARQPGVSTARSRSTSAQRASSSWSSCRAERSGGAARRRTCTRASRRSWTVRHGISFRRSTRSCRPTVTRRPSTGSSTRFARCRRGRSRFSRRRFRSGTKRSTKKALGVDHWFKDESWHDSLVRLVTQPTINIEGLVGGYTGTGGKTILPHRAVAKIDMRLVPDMTAKGTLELLKEHLAKHGFGDIEVNMSGGYDPTETDPDSKLDQGADRGVSRTGVEPLLWPRLAGSWPGVTFTGAPLKLAAGQFGLGHGDGAHAPDEYWIIESANPKVAGMDGAVRSFVEFFYASA